MSSGDPHVLTLSFDSAALGRHVQSTVYLPDSYDPHGPPMPVVYYLHGTVLPGGADWIIARPDGATTLDVRIVLQTDDGATIGLQYRGLRHGPQAVMDKVNAGQWVDPSEYYFRTVVTFETASPKYAWLNKVFGIGTGSRPPEGPVYDLFEVL